MTDKIVSKITQDDLICLEAESDDYSIEVDEGEIVHVERNMTFFHMLIIQNLYDLLKAFVREQELGYVFIDGGRYILAESKDDIQRAYKPDLSFLRSGRLPEDFDWHGDFEGAPDLAVEVISPGQRTPYFVRRIARYLEAGVEEVWLIDPMRLELHQYRADADTPRLYTESDTIVFEKLFPELKLAMSEVFRKP